MIYSVDQQTDFSKKETYQLLTGINLPSFIKTAEFVDDFDKLEKQAFADQGHRWFPLNTRDQVYLSNAFFVKNAQALIDAFGQKYVVKVAHTIGEAVNAWGIGEDVYEFNKIALDRLEEVYEDRAIVFKIASDEIDLFTIKTASDCTREANHFSNTINKYPFEWRRNIAEQFVKAAEALGLDELPDLVLKYAGQYYPDVVNVKSELSRRMTKLSADNQKRYQELIDDAENFSSKEDYFKLAECLHYVEKNAGLYDKSHYRKILGDPVDKLFTLHFEKMAELMNVIKLGDETFDASDLEKISSETYEQAFGFGIDPKCAEFRDIGPTLPRSDVQLFKHLTGIQPI